MSTDVRTESEQHADMMDAAREAEGEDAVTIQIVPDEMLACPGCGAYWGNPNKELDFPNRFKVDSFCRCYNPKCSVAYYDPFTGEVEYKGLEDA